MLIEATTKPLRVRLPGRVVRLVPGVPVDFSDEHAAKLLSKAPDAVRVVEPTPPEPPRTPDVDSVLGMPLEEFGRRHLALRIKLPDGSTCWFVSGPDEGRVLRSEGVPRGDMWTARELSSVIGDGWTRESIGRLIAVKREFDGTVAPLDLGQTEAP